MKVIKHHISGRSKETDLEYSLALVVPSTVLAGRQEICVAVFSSDIPENVEYYIKLTSTKKSTLIKATRVNNSAITFITPENFPPGSSQVSIYQGPGKHLICNYDVPIMFSSKLDFVKNLYELNTDPTSVINDAFELKECTSTVDILLERCFKLNITSNFNLPQYHHTDQNKISNPDLSSFYMPTLLHFAAHYNLVKLSIALLKCPGAAQLLVTKNYKGLTPMDIAAANGYLELTDVLSRFIDSITNRENFEQFVSFKPNTDYDSIYEITESNDGGLNDKRNSISSRISTSSNDSGIESKDTYVSLEPSCSKNHNEKKNSHSIPRTEAQEKSQIFQNIEDDIYDVPQAKQKNFLDKTISLPLNVSVPPVPDRLPNVKCSDGFVKRLVPPSPDRSCLLNKSNNSLKEQYKFSSPGGSADVYETMTSSHDLDQNASIYDKPKLFKNADKNDAIEIQNICEEMYDTPSLINQSPLNIPFNRNQHWNNKQQDSQKSMIRRHTAPNSTHSSYETITDSDKSSQKQNHTTDYEPISSSYVHYASSNEPVQQNNSVCNNEDLYDNPTKTSDNDEYEKFTKISTNSSTIYDVPTETFSCGQHEKNPNFKKLPDDRTFVSPHKINKDEASNDTSSSYQKAASTTRRHSTPVISADSVRSLNNPSRPPVLPPRQVNNSTCAPRLPPPRK
ncbi:phosphoinositide 3-kinase adapter protein 1 isoform X3 [Hydra vulgaris]|uniref:Phosphoinositide 3-kinase adapter protein 1 isoform X3 n=1 Tax=Hydra vulgaris TaxID=6087 RepID=A0ABM4D233_HYDVU